jgi:hypothetical protein
MTPVGTKGRPPPVDGPFRLSIERRTPPLPRRSRGRSRHRPCSIRATPGTRLSLPRWQAPISILSVAPLTKSRNSYRKRSPDASERVTGECRPRWGGWCTTHGGPSSQIQQLQHLARITARLSTSVKVVTACTVVKIVASLTPVYSVAARTFFFSPQRLSRAEPWGATQFGAGSRRSAAPRRRS